MYLEYTIHDAGIREVTFLLPKSMESARVTVPLLRQKTIEPVEGNPDLVRVRLQLQDEVMDQLIVLVEQDRALAAGPQAAPIPTLENTVTENRYIVLESEGTGRSRRGQHPGTGSAQPATVRLETSGRYSAGQYHASVSRGR